MKQALKKMKDVVGNRVLVQIGMTGSRVDFVKFENCDDLHSVPGAKQSKDKQGNLPRTPQIRGALAYIG